MPVLNLNPQELISMAIRIENNGVDYYSCMAEKASSLKVREIFKYLADEEKQHISDFMDIRDTLEPGVFEVPEEYLSPDIAAYLSSLADDRVFTNLFPINEIAAEIHNDLDAIIHAITFEKDTLLFFYEVHSIISEQETGKKAVLELIRQEKIHIAKLYTLMSGLNQDKLPRNKA